MTCYGKSDWTAKIKLLTHENKALYSTTISNQFLFDFRLMKSRAYQSPDDKCDQELTTTSTAEFSKQPSFTHTLIREAKHNAMKMRN